MKRMNVHWDEKHRRVRDESVNNHVLKTTTTTTTTTSSIASAMEKTHNGVWFLWEQEPTVIHRVLKSLGQK